MASAKTSECTSTESEAVRRIYPTAVRLVLHNRLNARRLPVQELAAFDGQGRALLPIRPEEMQDLKDRLNQTHGAGLIILDLSA